MTGAEYGDTSAMRRAPSACTDWPTACADVIAGQFAAALIRCVTLAS
jgi:hypothetical protein